LHIEPHIQECLSIKNTFVYIGLSSDATVLTPNTESSCDLMTKTKSTSGNDDSTSLDLEWEDEEGIYSAIQFHSKLTS